MIRADTLITKVARYLTDFDSTDKAYQHVEWSKADLLDYFRTAVTMVAAADSTASTCRKELPLVGDAILDLPEGCDELLKVIGYVNASGKLFTNIKLQKNEDDVFTSTRPVCAPGRATPAAFAVRLDEFAGDIITIEPPQSSGHLVLACSCYPDAGDETVIVNMSSKYEPVVFWWMVSMAFGTDIEAVPMRERSDRYWDRGAALLMVMSPKARVPQRGN